MSKHIDAKVGLAYLEGHLDGAQRAKLERHLADCTACQNQLQAHQTVHHLLQASEQVAAAEPVQIPNWSDIRPQAKRPTIWGNILQNGTQLGMATAAILLLFVFIWQLRPAGSVFEPVASGSASPTPTATPIETAVPRPTANFVPSIFPTIAKPIPTTTPTSIPAQKELTPIIGTDISAANLNTQGRAAFVSDGSLYVETAVNSGNFNAIAEHVNPLKLAWSADGQELLFFTQPLNTERPFLIHWNATTEQQTPLSELITNRSLPDVPFNNVHWSENGRELLLTTNGKLDVNSEWDSGVWLANLDSGKLTLVVEAISLVDALWLNENSFMMDLDCGQQCSILMAYDREQNLLWKAYADRPEREATSGLYVHQSSAQSIYHLNMFNSPQTIDEINTETGEITPLFTLPDHLYFAEETPTIAPDGHALIFQTIDENEQIMMQQLNLEDATIQPFAQQGNNLTLGTGTWSPNGNLFIYPILDSEIEASYVYLWQSTTNTTELIHVAATEFPFQNFVWATDSSRVYFNLANQSLWQYDVTSGELHTVAGQ